MARLGGDRISFLGPSFGRFCLQYDNVGDISAICVGIRNSTLAVFQKIQSGLASTKCFCNIAPLILPIELLAPSLA